MASPLKWFGSSEWKLLRRGRGLDVSYVIIRGVPNGTLSQDYLEGAPGANFPRIVDVNMQKTVALPPFF